MTTKHSIGNTWSVAIGQRFSVVTSTDKRKKLATIWNLISCSQLVVISGWLLGHSSNQAHESTNGLSLKIY